MAEASAVTPTGMSAVLGGDPAEVVAALERHGLTPANVNGAGQVVAAGTLDAARRLRRRPAGQGPGHPAAGRRRVPHRAHGPAVDALQRRLVRPRRPRPAVSPCCPTPTARRSPTGAEVARPPRRARCRNPVRWDLCMETFIELGVTGAHRARAGRHARRPGQARAAGRRAVAAQDPGRPRRRPRASSRSTRHDRHLQGHRVTRPAPHARPPDAGARPHHGRRRLPAARGS